MPASTSTFARSSPASIIGTRCCSTLQGNVVYSVNKGPDLGTNILTGPYRESNLRDAYEKALAANDVDFVWITDFQPYPAALDAPMAWVVSPIGFGGQNRRA